MPNINFLATGSYDHQIRLWDLRNSTFSDDEDMRSIKKDASLKGITSPRSKKSGKSGKRGKYSHVKSRVESTRSKGSTDGDGADTVKGNLKTYDKAYGKVGGKKKEKDNEPQEDYQNWTCKLPTKILKGHEKAVREIAYSERHKILVSCGFDFEVFVWNPYYEKYIIKLDGHESPLVGVNCPSNLPCFITCDTNGMVKVWNINDYSCT